MCCNTLIFVSRSYVTNSNNHKANSRRAKLFMQIFRYILVDFLSIKLIRQLYLVSSSSCSTQQ